MTVDVDRLDHLLAWATEEDAKKRRGEPSQWDQGIYLERNSSCGTVCCIAGKVVLEDGVLLRWSADCGDYARKALGLSEDQASALFFPTNNLEMLRGIVAGIKQGLDDDLIWSLHDELRAAAS